MTDFATETTFIAVVYFVLPSAIAIWVYDRIVPTEKRDWGAAILLYACYGVLLYVLSEGVLQMLAPFWPASVIAFPLYRISIDVRFIIFGWIGLPLLVGSLAGIIPKAGASLLKKLSSGLFLHPEPTAWDYVFANRRRARYILFHLDDGTVVGGLYAKDSYVSTFPQPQQIYVQEALIPTAQEWQKQARTDGLLISMDKCKYIEFFQVIKKPVSTSVSIGGRKKKWTTRIPILVSIQLRVWNMVKGGRSIRLSTNAKGVTEHSEIPSIPSHHQDSEVALQIPTPVKTTMEALQPSLLEGIEAKQLQESKPVVLPPDYPNPK